MPRLLARAWRRTLQLIAPATDSSRGAPRIVRDSGHALVVRPGRPGRPVLESRRRGARRADRAARGLTPPTLPPAA